MTLILEAIAFNHDLQSSRRSALNIRKNATSAALVPEWRRGGTVRATDSVAAYAVEELGGEAPRIRASFTRLTSGLSSIEVRAVKARPPTPPSGMLEWLALAAWIWPQYRPYVWSLEQLRIASARPTLLGNVKAKTVQFGPAETSKTVEFELENSFVAQAPVGIHLVPWEWQYRPGPGRAWKAFAETKHTIYTVLGLPNAPWQLAPATGNNTQLPWSDVLAYACRWAAGARSVDDAASRITRAVYQLGRGLIGYDCVDVDGYGPDFLGTPHYTWFDPSEVFECTLFLERLQGQVGGGPHVNCTDCSAIVSTFANALGCDLWQSRMGYGFSLNPFLAIGSSKWEKACRNWGSFFMHEVAWSGQCTDQDTVYDACVAVDGSGSRRFATRLPVVPANVPFSSAGAVDYRDYLAAATPSGQGRCVARPSTRKRRFVI